MSNAGKWIIGGLLGAMALSFWLTSIGVNSRDIATAIRESDTPRLELLSSRGYASSSAYMKVEGEVKNITNEPIDRIRAVVTWRTKAGELITTDEAMIEYRPLMPGQTSPFSTLSTKNPLMDTYGVAFAIGSRPIAVKDSRK